MTINRSDDLSKIYTYQLGPNNFLPVNFPTATSPAWSHLFNHVPDGKPYDRIKYLSIIMEIMYVARLTRPDVLLAITYLPTKAQHPKEGDYNAALRIISYQKGGIPQVMVSS